MRSSYLLVASLAAVFAVSWYDLSQGLIIIPCHHSGIDGWWLCLVEAFNLIEFFGVAALFGWFTFLVGTNDMIDRIESDRKEREERTKKTKTFWPFGKDAKQVEKEKEERQETRRKLNTINDYFIISFVFYAIAALSDYFFKHHTILGESAEYGLASLTLVSFAAGTMVLALPVLYLLLLDSGRNVFVQRKLYAFAFAFLSVGIIVALALVLPKDPPTRRYIIAVPSLVTMGGLYWAMADKMTARRLVEVLSVFLLSWVAVAILVALKITYLDLPH
jgi:hypothetical protein